MPPLLIPALLLLQQGPPPEMCSLSGTVVDSVTGAPLNKVELRLEPLDRQAAHVAAARSDTGGRFAMVNLSPGIYRLRGRRNGYLETAYGARTPGRNGSLLRLAAGQSLDRIGLKLVPAAVIAGTVWDSDGEPLAGAHVVLARFTYLYGRGRVESFAGTDTDDRGEYRFSGLAAGRYYVSVEPGLPEADPVDHSPPSGPREQPVPTLYPGVPGLPQAAPVETSAGRQTTGIDVTLLRSRVFRVSGRVLGAPPAGRITLALRDRQNAGVRDYDLQTSTRGAAGDFEFRDVPPGSYDLIAAHGFARVPVTVGASDVEGVRVALAPGAEVRLSFVPENAADKPDLSGLSFFLTADGRSGFTSLPFQRDRFSRRDVPPGHYTLKLSGSLLQRFYVKSARAGDADVLADGLAVEGPGAIDIRVVLASGGAALEGLVRDADHNPVSGATVLLVPARSERPDLFKSTTSDQNGRYEFTAIAPGSYRVFAWEDVEPGIWNDPGFLENSGEGGGKAELEANARAVLHLPLAHLPDRE